MRVQTFFAACWLLVAGCSDQEASLDRTTQADELDDPTPPPPADDTDQPARLLPDSDEPPPPAPTTRDQGSPPAEEEGCAAEVRAMCDAEVLSAEECEVMLAACPADDACRQDPTRCARAGTRSPEELAADDCRAKADQVCSTGDVDACRAAYAGCGLQQSQAAIDAENLCREVGEEDPACLAALEEARSADDTAARYGYFKSCNGHCGDVSPFGSCQPECVYSGNCLPDVRTYCAVDQEDVVVTSCATQVPVGRSNRCGLGLAPFEQGCECSASCGLTGTCCTDITTTCQSAFLPTPAGDGQQWLQKLSSSGTLAYAAGSHRKVDVRHLLPTAARVFYALRQVRFGDIDTRNEESRCISDTVSVNGVPVWRLLAGASYDDNDAKCGVSGVRIPASSGLHVYNDVILNASNNHTQHAFYAPADDRRIFALSGMAGQDIDDDGGEAIECFAEYGSWTNGQWHLGASAEDDSRAQCRYRQISWDAGTPVSVTGEYRAFWLPEPFWGPPDPQLASRRILVPDRNATCFLTGIRMSNADDPKEFPGCDVTVRNGMWTLYALGAHHQDNTVACRARCLVWDDDPGARWPRKPDADLDVWQKVGNGYTHAGRATLWLGRAPSGTVAYDRPTVLIEGFDPLDRIGSSIYEVKAADFMRTALSTQVDGKAGDVWFFSPDGLTGDSLEASQRQVALMVQLAWTYRGYNQQVGRPIVVAGISQGGLTGRVMLAEWEAGAYTDVEGKYSGAQPSVHDPYFYDINYWAYILAPSLWRPIPRVDSAPPPVGLFLAFAGPQTGASVPRAASAVLNEIADGFAGSAPALAGATIVKMVTAQAAKEMLSATAHGYPSYLTSRCTMFNKITFRDGANDLYGTEPAQPTMFGPGNGVTTDLQTSAAYFAAANASGPAHNGYPTGPLTVSLVNAGFQPLGCSTLAPDDRWCRRPSPDFNASHGWNASSTFQMSGGQGPAWAVMRFSDTGHSFISLCDRDSRAYLRFGQASEVSGGDLGEVNFEDVRYDATGLPAQVNHFWVKQLTPFLRTPTTSALHCPGATSLAACRQQNRQAGRFDEVLGRSDGLNGVHGGMDSDMSRRAMALWWDFMFDNQDGMLKNSQNPFGCDFTAESQTGTRTCPTAAQVCQSSGQEIIGNHFDDDCNGVID